MKYTIPTASSQPFQIPRWNRPNTNDWPNEIFWCDCSRYNYHEASDLLFALDSAVNHPNPKTWFNGAGDEAAIVGDLGEETGLLGASFMSSRVPASARKKFFSNPRNLQAYSFKPGKRAENESSY